LFYVQILTRIMVGVAFVSLAPRLFVSPLFTLLWVVTVVATFWRAGAA
jgi:hypothetical protein